MSVKRTSVYGERPAGGGRVAVRERRCFAAHRNKPHLVQALDSAGHIPAKSIAAIEAQTKNIGLHAPRLEGEGGWEAC